MGGRSGKSRHPVCSHRPSSLIDAIRSAASASRYGHARETPQVVLAKGGAWHEPELIRCRYTSASLAKSRKTFGIVAWKDR